MSKKRSRITNPEPFLPVGSDAFSAGKKRAKPPKHHQLEEKLLPSTVSSKILKVALQQQKEIDREEDDNDKAADQNPDSNIVFPQNRDLKDDDNDDDDDVDDFDGFSETQSQFGQYNFEVCSVLCFN